MRKFQVLRYLTQWKYLILLITVIGSVLIYSYGVKNQTYTATAIMEYTGKSAAEGKNANNTDIDVTEINSAAVITDVINELGLSTNVESIRSACRITEIIPPEEEEKRESALKLGEEYSYFPTNYKVSFTAGSDKSKEYAQDVLDSILTNYFSLYCRKYVNYSVFPNNATNVSTEQYDYVDCLDILEETAGDIIYYLEARADKYPEFRSAETGYSFADLKEVYDSIKDYQIPNTYAYVLNNRLVKDRDLLLQRYENTIAQYKYEIENCATQIEEANSIITQFGDKALESNAAGYGSENNQSGVQDIIINNVEDNLRNEETTDSETTYDKLTENLLQFKDKQIKLETKLERCEEILSIYSDTSIVEDSESEKARRASNEISHIVENMKSLYAIVTPTVDEFNEKMGADNLSMRTSISTHEKYNMNVFLILALLFFFALSCTAAVVFGRIGDFVEYFMYIDRKTGLHNRNRCDIMIENYEEKLLPENFVCLTFKLELRNFDNQGFTRKDGDVLLSQFGKFIKNLAGKEHFAGYNDSGMFLMFVEKCSDSKAYSYIDRLLVMTDEYNTDAKFPIKFQAGICESTESGIYDIRELLRQSIISLKPAENYRNENAN